MTSTSASPARLVVVAPVERKFTTDWSPLISTCSITSVSLKQEPASRSPNPTFSQSNTILNNEHTNGFTTTTTTTIVDDTNGVSIADCSATSGDSSIKDSKNSSSSSMSMAILDHFNNDDRFDGDDNDDGIESLPIINDDDCDEHNIVEPLILAKRRKSKRRRWILSRKPKCISRTQRIIFPTTIKTKQNSKRKHLINGLDTEASDDQDPPQTPSKSAPTPSSSSMLEPAVHASVFLPHQCRWPSSSMDVGVEPASLPCLQSEMTKNLLPHLNDLLSGYTNDVYRWSLDDVAKFVRTIPYSGGVAVADKLADKFKDELIDGEALLLLTQNDLIKQMQIKLGPALKIYSSVLYVKHQRFKR